MNIETTSFYIYCMYYEYIIVFVNGGITKVCCMDVVYVYVINIRMLNG